MKFMKMARKYKILAFTLAALFLAAAPSLAIDMVALESQATMPDGQVITMWGYAEDTGQTCGTTVLPAWNTGPVLTAVAGDSLTVNLRNCLDEPVSIVILGQTTPTVTGGIPMGSIIDADNRQRFTSFTDQAPAAGTVSYTWDNLKAGTYLYHSGSHPAKQVQMGLYGILKVNTVDADPVAGTPAEAYAGYPYTSEVVLLYSEIDPALHDPTPKTAQTIHYKPRYFLVNGQPYHAATPVFMAGNASQPTMVRLINAGLITHAPNLLGDYMDLIAEDGNLYPYKKSQYSVLLPAGKTMDALWIPKAAGTYPIYDRSHHLTTAGVTGGGMLSRLEVGTAAGAPVAVNDSAMVAEGGTVSVLGSGAASVLANDTGSSLSAILVSSVSNGSLTLNPDGTFTYTHNGSQTTTDSFTYKAQDTVSGLESSVAKVSIMVTPVNTPPIAADDAYDAATGTMLMVSAPGLLANDSDPDGDALSVSPAPVSGPAAGALNALNADGSFSYTPAGTIGSTDTFVYEISDGNGGTATATVTLTVVGTPANQPPVANDDFASVMANGNGVTINVLSNDFDPDGTLMPATVNIGAKPAAKGAKATVNANGTITYTPKRNFRGTDVFTYTVEDNDGAVSNEGTVRVNVL